MRLHSLIAALVVLLLSNAAVAQYPQMSGQAGPKNEAGPVIQTLQKAAVRALNYKQGDRDSLEDAKDDFSPLGWGEFMHVLDGWLDNNGAPALTSTFSPSGPVLDVAVGSNVASLVIPGVLKQESKNAGGGVSSTTYRVEVTIQAEGSPIKIEHLKTKMCGGAEKVSACR